MECECSAPAHTPVINAVDAESKKDVFFNPPNHSNKQFGL